MEVHYKDYFLTFGMLKNFHNSEKKEFRDRLWVVGRQIIVCQGPKSHPKYLSNWSLMLAKVNCKFRTKDESEDLMAPDGDSD